MTSPNCAVWVDAAGPYSPSDRLASEEAVDVAVVGAGVMGLLTAWHLRRRAPSLAVAVVDQATVGSGSSGRNNGVLTRRLGFSAPYIRRLYGAQRLSELFAYTTQSLEHTRELIRSHDLDCDYHAHIPHLKLAFTDQLVSQLHEAYATDEATGTAKGQEWLDEDQLDGRFNGPLMRGGAALLDRDDDGINPVQYVRELKRLVVDAGAVVYENTPVIDIRAHGHKYRLVTPNGALIADKIVIATNGYTHQLPGNVVPKGDQWPVYAYKIATEPVPDAAWEDLGWEPHMRAGDALMPWHSMRRTSDNRITFGGVFSLAEAALGHEYEPRAFETLERHFHVFFPTLTDVRVTHRWGGLLSMTFDLLPHIGYVDADRRVARVSGCWGHGMAMGYLNGQVVSSLVLGQEDEFADHWMIKRRVRTWPATPVRVAGMRAAMGGLTASSRRMLKRAAAAAPEARRKALTELMNT